MKMIPSTTLRDHLADTLDALSDKEKYFIITKNSRPVSALVDLDFFEDLLAASSPTYLASIREARADYEAGNLFSHEEVFGLL